MLCPTLVEFKSDNIVTVGVTLIRHMVHNIPVLVYHNNNIIYATRFHFLSN